MILDLLVKQDQLDQQEILVHLVLQVRGVTLVIEDHQDNQDRLGNQVP